MTSIKYASAAGKKYETDLLKFFRENSLDVERLRLTGEEDEGDLLIRLDPFSFDSPPRRLVIEAKRRKAMDLGGWIQEAQIEAQNYGKHRGFPTGVGFVVVHYRRQHNISQSYVTTTLEEYLRQIGVEG